MTGRVLLTVVAGLAFANTAPAFAQLEPDRCAEYRGTLGERTVIGMSLLAHDQKLTGSYFYAKYLKDIALAGSYASARDIVLEERDASGKLQGKFTLRFVESDPSRKSERPLTADVLRGTWSSASGQRSLPVYLALETMGGSQCAPRYAVAGASDDALVERNAQAFYNAVAKGQKTVAAKFVRYPVSFTLNGKRRKAANAAEFLQYYERIFTPAFVAKIAAGVPHHMFANAQGIMIADGAVWFDESGKVTVLNNGDRNAQ